MIHIWLIPFSIQRHIRIMIFIDVVKSKWAIILNCQHIIKYESERGFGAVLTSRVSAALDPGVVPAVTQLVLPAQAPLGWVGGGGTKNKKPTKKSHSFSFYCNCCSSSCSTACAAHIVEIKLLLVKSSVKKPWDVIMFVSVFWTSVHGKRCSSTWLSHCSLFWLFLNVNEEKLEFIVKSLAGAESGVGISERINRQ